MRAADRYRLILEPTLRQLVPVLETALTETLDALRRPGSRRSQISVNASRESVAS
jgi:hypothetical protein